MNGKNLTETKSKQASAKKACFGSSELDRFRKYTNGFLLTEEEFIAEAGENCYTETLGEIYLKLVQLMFQKKIDAGEIYRYARSKRCLQKNPEAIIAYAENKGERITNKFGTELCLCS